MAENRKLEDGTLEETAGGSFRAGGDCDTCGAEGYTESITLHLSSRTEMNT